MGFFDDIKAISTSVNEVKQSLTDSVKQVAKDADDAKAELTESVDKLTGTAKGSGDSAGAQHDESRQND